MCCVFSGICLKTFVVCLLSVPVPGKVSFKLHLCRQQLTNLLSRPRGGCEVIVNGVIRFLRLLLTTARCTPPPPPHRHPPESKDHSSAATCWRRTCTENNRTMWGLLILFNNELKTWSPIATERVHPLPPAMDGSATRKVSVSLSSFV